MTEDLQQLLEKIQRDGVDKAQTEADAIVQKARQEAESIVAAAREQAEKSRSEAQSEADAFARRAEESIRQAARDVLLHVEKSVTTLFETLLRKQVDQALDSAEIATTLVQAAVKAYLEGNGGIELAASEKMLDTLRAAVSAMAAEGIAVELDRSVGSGFRVKLADGRIEHDFTGAAVAETLARQLRPGLAAMLKS
jgi:V/A-type H+/Na+-transporting ATPase subunit E